MESLNYSLDYFVHFLKKSITHFNIIRENYNEFQSEFDKIREFVSQSDSQIIKKNFEFLLSPQKDNLILKNDATSNNKLNYAQMKNQLKSIKYLTLIVMHLSKNN